MTEPVNILGIDFTSAPRRRKPITCVRAVCDGKTFEFEELLHWHDFDAFEGALSAPGAWVAGIDFPFGQARRFVENVGWPLEWGNCIAHVASLDRAGFRKALEEYKRNRRPGDRHHKRVCDVLTRSQSPQTLFGTPVGLMFFEGAPRLLHSGAHLPHHGIGRGSRIVVEAYPGFAARQLIGNRSYKNDRSGRQTQEHFEARREIVERLTGPPGQSMYGVAVEAPAGIAADPGADDLDALLCCVQAAWAWRRRKHGFGAPAELDTLEGWIADPGLAAAALEAERAVTAAARFGQSRDDRQRYC